MGPNGAGKTTLIKLLTCLLYPDEGTASVNGFDIRKEGDKVRASMNVIISGGWLGFNFALTVQQNLEFFARIYGLQKGLAKERVGTDNRLPASPDIRLRCREDGPTIGGDDYKSLSCW